MKYLNMLPYQIRQAIDCNVPVALALGVVEYHAEHLPVGVDAYVAMEVIDRVEKRRPELVVLPAFYYGAASYAVAAPERNGTLQVDSAHLIPVAEDIFRSLLRVGFRNIHAFIAHQTEGFAQGMPTDLAFRFAARRVLFEYLEKEAGEGWWGTEQYSAYYSGANNPFHWIQIHPVRCTQDVSVRFPGDHAGQLETSETMVICSEHVALDRLDERLWYSRPGRAANAAYGEEALEETSKAVETVLFGG